MEFAVKVSVVTHGNSILCTACGKWIHKRSSGVKGIFVNVHDFECSICKAGITKQDDLDLRIGRDTRFERVETFCYLGDLPSLRGLTRRGINLKN